MPATLSTSILRIQARNLRGDLDLTTTELEALLDLAAAVKRTPAQYTSALRGNYISLLFEKPSLRTRLTFELAIKQLGGDAVTSIGMIGDREPVQDIARNLDRWTQCIAARVFAQQTIDDLARWSSVPVINALSDLYHPCQAFADLQTMHERFGRLNGLKLAFVAIAAQGGSKVTVTNSAGEAVDSAHVIYTDVWASMGQESEAARRREIFRPYQVDDALMARARPDAIFLHCLPAKRGQEVTDAVIESAQSAVFDQAENRLHAQKALLLMLLS